MLRFVVAPDSYKGSLTSVQVGQTIARGVLQEIPNAEVDIIPMSDGGEGMIDSIVAATEGHKVPFQTTGPLGEKIDSYFGVFRPNHSQKEKETGTVILEAANILGLTMVPEERRNPLYTTSKGLGEAIVFAIENGYRKFVIGLGGSSTNDGGLGLLQALGVGIYDQFGLPVEGFGKDLEKIRKVDFHTLDPRIAECDITIASDVQNPLCGPKGASFVYGPQKGATAEQIIRLDQAMGTYARMVEEQIGCSVQNRKGAGAAGGLGFALLAVGGKIVAGAQLVEEITGLRQKIQCADWVITGEGKSDRQTLYGKLPLYVAELAKQTGTKSILISGSLDDEQELLRKYFAGIFSTVTRPSTLQECMENAEKNLFDCARTITRFIQTIQIEQKGGTLSEA
jgi:glycerate kinase